MCVSVSVHMCMCVSVRACEQIATCDAYRATNQLRMAARGALEWIGMFEGPAGF